MDNTRNGLCGRMCRAPCPLTMGRISGRSLKASLASKTPKQMFLCRRTINGCRQERSWATVILSPGECSTRRRVGASHKDEKRVFAVLDLAGQRAGQVLFESEGVSGYTPPRGEARQGAAAGAAGGVGAAGCAGRSTGGFCTGQSSASRSDGYGEERAPHAAGVENLRASP